MKLLVEKIDNFETNCDVEILNENGKRVKNYYIHGIFLQSEVQNHNKRFYPKKILLKEVERFRKQKINDNQAVGELGHPDSPTINLDRVSHKIISLEEKGNNFIGKAKILDTPFGKIVKNLMDENVKFGVSSRGMGSLKEINGVNEVCDDFMLVTPADIVSEPSAPDAFVTALLENKEWVWENNNLILKEKEIKKYVNSQTEKELLKVFERILNNIK